MTRPVRRENRPFFYRFKAYASNHHRFHPAGDCRGHRPPAGRRAPDHRSHDRYLCSNARCQCQRSGRTRDPAHGKTAVGNSRGGIRLFDFKPRHEHGRCPVLCGEDEEEAIVRLQSKLTANYDRIPWQASPPLIKPSYIDDVPILALTFWSADNDHYTLRRVASEVENRIKREKNTSITTLIGGESRQMTVQLDPVRLAAFSLDPRTVARQITATNQAADAGSYPSLEGQIRIHTGDFLKNALDVRQVVVGVHQGRPIYLRDVATVQDGSAEPNQYVFSAPARPQQKKGLRIELSPAEHIYPAVTLTVAKRKGTNAISVAEKILKRIEDAQGDHHS